MNNGIVSVSLQVSPRVLAWSLAVMIGGTASLVQSQEYDNEEVVLFVPSERSLLQMQVVYPRVVRMEQSFPIRVVVSNRSDDTVFHNIRMGQIGRSSLQFENVRGEQTERGQSGEVRQAEDAGAWTISRLGPGESQSLRLMASASDVGPLDACLGILAYTPSVCIQSRVIEPEIEIVKRAPERASICQNLIYEYFVKNTGTGALDAFVIRDRLDEGIATLRGEKELEFRVDGLEEREVRRFRAEVRPLRAGTFGSRGIAIEPGGETTRSAAVSTKVVAPRLSVELVGPTSLYVGRPSTYALRVSNYGEATAENTVIRLAYPDALTLLGVGSWEQSQAGDMSGTDHQTNQGNLDPRQDVAFDADWELGDLGPSQSRQVSLTFRGDGEAASQLFFMAEALAFCGEEADELIARARDQLQIETVSLPALGIVLVDQEDPARGDDVSYTAVVTNEGTAADEDLQLTIELPENLEFSGATGETRGRAEGRRIVFNPIERLGPGERAVWRIDARVTGEGDVATRARLTSKMLPRAITTEEPTTLIAGRPSDQRRR